jgi:hypothetical protein
MATNRFDFTPEGTSETDNQFGFVPDEAPKKPSKRPPAKLQEYIRRAAESPLTQAILGAGRAVQEPFYQAAGVVNPLLGMKPPQLRVPAGKGIAGEIGGIIGGIAPFTGAAKIGGAAARLAPMLGGKLGRAGGMAAYGALMSPEDRAMGAAWGAIASPFADLLGGGKRLSEEAISKLAKKAEPYANKYIKERLGKILSEIRGTSSKGMVNSDIYNAQKKYYSELITPSVNGKNTIPIENRLYTKYHVASNTLPADIRQNMLVAGKSLEKHFDPEKYYKQVESEKKDIERQAGVFRAKEEPEAEPEKKLSYIGQKYAQRQDMMSAWDKEHTTIPTFSAADDIKIALNQEINALKHGDPLRPAYARAKEAIRDDVDDAFLRHGSPEQRGMWRRQDNTYKSTIVPFKELNKFTKTPFWRRYMSGEEEKAPPISTLVDEYIRTKTGADVHEPIANLMKTTPTELRHLPGYSYLREAEDEEGKAMIQPLLSRYSRLGSKQRKLLYPNHYEELNGLLKLKELYPKAFKEPAGEPKVKVPFNLHSLLAAAGAAGAGYTGHYGLAALAALFPYTRQILAKQVGKSPKAFEAFLRKGGIGSRLRPTKAPRKGAELIRKAREKATRPIMAAALAQALQERGEQ